MQPVNWPSMASKTLKRKVDTPDQNTPVGKKSKQITRSAPPRTRSGTKTKQRREEQTGSVPEPFVILDESDQEGNMACNNNGQKPATADELRDILRESLAGVAKKDDLDRLMIRVDGNAGAIRDLNTRITDIEGQFRTTTNMQEERLRAMEVKIDRAPTETSSREAAYDKARRSLRIWPIDGEDENELLKNFRDFAIDALLIPDGIFQDTCLLYTSPSPRDRQKSRMPSSA